MLTVFTVSSSLVCFLVIFIKISNYFNIIVFDFVCLSGGTGPVVSTKGPPQCKNYNSRCQERANLNQSEF